MEQDDWLEEFRASIREEIQKEAKQELAEEVARIFFETSNYDDEKIAKIVSLDIQQVCFLRKDYNKWVFSKNLPITEEPQYIADDFYPKTCI